MDDFIVGLQPMAKQEKNIQNNSFGKKYKKPYTIFEN